ncbi:MAG TPA: hypothetical protein PLB89_17935, partial [Flavobacteriales bacterium]|nr:hypothetical protein [Flavobacteriales bacterium]
RTLISDANGLWVCGGFTDIAGEQRNLIALLDPGTGTATNWQTYVDQTVRCVVDLGDEKVFLGGEFTAIGGEMRHNLAAFDTNTGALTSWAPDANAAVHTLAIGLDNTLYMGGEFTEVDGLPRGYIASAGADGSITNWDPGATGPVLCLVVDENIIHVGGSFSNIGGQPRGNIAALDVDDASVLDFDPGTDGPVRALVSSNGALYFGGEFLQVGGQPRDRLAAAVLSSGDLLAWAPEASATVRTLVSDGDVIYAGGNFSGPIGGQIRNHLAALDPITGNATAWVANANGPVHSLHEVDGLLHVGGDFSIIGGQLRNNLALVSTNTGSVQGWTPLLDGVVNSVRAADGRIHIGGNFFNAENLTRRSYAVYTKEEITLVTEPGTLCEGDDLDVVFTVPGVYGQGNVFAAQLSGPDGSFDAPTELGTLEGSDGGTINTILPQGLPVSNDWRIRVISSLPEVTSNASPAFAIDAPQNWYVDADMDGFGDPELWVSSCAPPPGTSADNTDCDDSDESVYIGATCDDGNMNTADDVWTVDCLCLGDLINAVVEADGLNTLRAWPNPAHHTLQLNLPTTASIQDALGRTVLQVNNTMVVNIEVLAPGHYVLRPAKGAQLQFVVQ